MQTFLIILASIVVLFVVIEVYARCILQLGNPVLWKPDPEIEYLPLPNQKCLRFGKQISYNSYSMRSREFPKHKTDPHELRILMVGDSVINGGATIDQEELVSTLIERKLAKELNRSVIVGNISAGSWGPPNYLAYLKRYGFFNADILVIVLNSPDYADAPTFEPLDHRRPQQKPFCASLELIAKYVVLRYIKRIKNPKQHPLTMPERAAICLNALRELVQLTRDAGIRLIVAQHLKRSEVEHKPEIGHREIANLLKSLEIEPLQLGPVFAEALRRQESPYIGNIHTNASGQQIIAKLLTEELKEHVSALHANDTAPNNVDSL